MPAMPGISQLGVIEEGGIALFHGVPQHVSRLIIAHAVPGGGPSRAVRPEVVDAEGVGFGFEQPMIHCRRPSEKFSKSRLRRQRIQAHVPWVCANTRVGALAVEGEADQPRTAPVPPVTPEGERTIVEAAAHPQAPAPRVDAHQRHDDEIEPARADGAAVRGAVRDRDAEHAAPRLARQRVEAQAPMAQVARPRERRCASRRRRAATSRAAVFVSRSNGR